MRDALVVIQMATMVALAAYFFKDGLAHLGVAQCCYVVATGALFIAGANS
jgi:hypothetical protein